jgi:DNA-binding SARP family transcriptional activator
LTAATIRITALQQLGRHQELIPELRALVLEHPLNERFHSHLIEALHRCGRRAEALQAYRALHGTQRSELGVDPAPEVQRLHHDVLAGNPLGTG